MKQQQAVTSAQFKVAVLLFIAVILAAFFRFFHLEQTPPGFTNDEIRHALDALDVLNGKFTLISPRIRQAPMGYMYVLAVAFQVFGVSIFIQRTLTAIFGLLLIVVNFFAVRFLFDEESKQKASWIAAFSSLLLSTSLWGIFVSRIGYEYILTSVFSMIAIFFFWRGYQARRWGSLLVAGIFAAMGFYFYIGSAPFLLVIPTAFLLNALLYRIFPKLFPKKPQLHIKEFALFLAAVFLIAMPLFLVLVAGSESGVERTTEQFIFTRAYSPVEGIALLKKSFVAQAQTFLAIKGDRRWYANVAERPILDPVMAMCFVGGILISLKRISQLPYLFLLVYWGWLVAPTILTSGSSANHFRMSGALPPTYIFIAVAWTELYYWLSDLLTSFHWDRVQNFASSIALLPFLMIGLAWQPFQSYHNYFVIWANHPKVATKAFGKPPTFKLIERMESETDPEAIFIVPCDAFNPEPNMILDSFYQGKAPIRYICVDEITVRQRLTSALENYRIVHLISGLNAKRELLGFQTLNKGYADPGGYLSRVLERYGKRISTEETKSYTILTYELNSNHTYFADFKPLSFILADELKLVGIEQHQEGNNLFVDLVWQRWTKATHDYTVSVQLLDSNDERVVGVDVLPARGFTTMNPNGTMITNYTISLSDEMKPGTYTMLVILYYFADDELVTVDAVTLKEPIVLK